MGIFSWLCCCFGSRLETDDIVDMLSREKGIETIGGMHGLSKMTRKDCTSCNTTAILIGKIIQGNLSQMSGSTLGINDIMEGLQSRMAVIVNIKPDHWFTVLPDDSTHLVMLQSYQDLYDVGDWLRATDGGRMSITSFQRSLGAVLNGGSPEEAVKLFSRGEMDARTIARDFADGATISTLYKVGSFKWKLN